MHRWGEQKKIRFVEKELHEFDLSMAKYGEGQTIFVGSSCDMFAEKIPVRWIIDTLKKCKEYENTYLFQSKNPLAFDQIVHASDRDSFFPTDSLFCTTIETNRIYFPEMGSAVSPYSRASAMNTLKGYKKYVTIEPIMDFDLNDMVGIIKACEPIQVNIGADSGGNNLIEPPKEKILELINELKKFTVIDQKRNLNRILNK
jgi:hypothetical protein